MMAARVGGVSAVLMVQHFVQSWQAFVMCIHGWHVMYGHMCIGTSGSICVLLGLCLHAMLVKARKCWCVIVQQDCIWTTGTSITQVCQAYADLPHLVCSTQEASKHCLCILATLTTLACIACRKQQTCRCCAALHVHMYILITYQKLCNVQL